VAGVPGRVFFIGPVLLSFETKGKIAHRTSKAESKKRKRGAEDYFYSEVLEDLGDKISNSSTPIPDKGYDARRKLPILSPIEFSRFHCENKLTLPC
jgi:hypothetical protein